MRACEDLVPASPAAQGPSADLARALRGGCPAEPKLATSAAGRLLPALRAGSRLGSSDAWHEPSRGGQAPNPKKPARAGGLRRRAHSQKLHTIV